MDTPSVLERVSSPIGDILPPHEKFAFLAGAGISMDAPSSIPSAREFVRALLEYCAPAPEIDALISLKPLRYELMVEKIKEILDPDLHFLDYFETIKEPNANHYFLATAIVTGKQHVITTNFDESIERAIEQILEPGQQERIVPVITRKDFVMMARPLDVFKAGKYPLYKIHGSKRNAITGERTADSIVTTISALGKDRGIGETFAMESYKKQAIYNLVKNRVLVVMGYSGSDDFDIGPTLRGMRYIKRLVWIDYAPIEGVEIYKVKGGAPPALLSSCSQVERILAGIASSGVTDVYLIKARTGEFIKTIAWPLLYPGTTNSLSNMTAAGSKPPSFKDWFFAEFKGKKVSEIERRALACSIFGDLGEFNACTRNATAGLALATEAVNPGWEAYFLNQLTRINLSRGEMDQARIHADQALAAARKTKHPIKQAIATCNAGLVALRMGGGRPSQKSLQEARSCYMEALHLFESARDEWGKVACLNNLAEVDAWEGKHDVALNQLMECSLTVMRLGNLEFKATIASNIGWMLAAWDDKTDAIKQLLDARNVRKELGDALGVARVANRLSSMYMVEGRLDEAVKELDIASENAAGRGDVALEARLLETGSWIQFRAGNLQRSTETCKQAMALNRSRKDDLSLALGLSLYASLAWLDGRHWDAASCLEEAASLYGRIELMSLAAEAKQQAHSLGTTQVGESSIPFPVDKWLAMLPDEIKGIADPGTRATAALKEFMEMRGKNSPEPKIKAALLAGVALHQAGRDHEALECWAAGFSMNEVTPAKGFPVPELRESLVHAGIVLLPSRRLHVDFDPIFRDDTDISPSNQIDWMPAKDNRIVFKTAMQLVESARAALDKNENDRAVKVLEQARRLIDEIHRDDMTEMVDSLLFEANLKLGRVDGSPEAIIKRATEKVAFYSERATRAADIGDKKAVITAVEDSLTYMDILAMVNPVFKDQAALAREQVGRLKEQLATAEENQERAREAIASLDQTDIISAIEYLLDNPETMEREHDPEANLELDHAEDDAYWDLLGKVKAMMMFMGKVGNIQAQAEACLNLGGLHLSRKEYKAALARFNMAFRQALLTGTAAVEARSISGIGDVLFAQKRIGDALDKYEFALRMYDDIGASMATEKAYVLSRIGIIYESRGDVDLALERFGELASIQLPADKINLKADALAHMGIIEMRHGLEDLAYPHLFDANELFAGIAGSEQARAAVLQQLAIIDSRDGFVDMAIEDLENSLACLKQIGLESDIPREERKLAMLKARLEDPKSIVEDESNRALSLVRMNRFPEAVVAIDTAVRVAREHGMVELLPKLVSNQALINEAAGDTQADSGDLIAAKESYATATSIMKASGDEKGCNAISSKVKSIDARLDDPATAVPLLEARARTCLASGQLDQGVSLIDQALALRERATNLTGLGSALLLKARLLQSASKHVEARKTFFHAIQQLDIEGKKDDLLDAIFKLSLLPPAVVPPTEAMTLLERGTGIARDINNTYGLGLVLDQLGRLYMTSKQYDHARNALDEACRIFEAMPNAYLEATTRLKLGDLAHATGDEVAALDQYEKALRTFEEIEKPQDKASALNKIGIVHETQSNYHMALETYKASIELATQVNDEWMLAACTFNAGNVYRMDGDLENATKYMNDAMAIASKHNVAQYKAPFLSGLALIDMRRGSLAQAADKAAKSLQLYEQLGDWEGMATAEDVLAGISLIQGDLERARGHLDAAFNHPEMASNPKARIDPLLTLAVLDFLQGRTGEATDHAMEALTLATNAKDKMKAANASERLARFARKLGNPEAEQKWVNEASRLYTEMGLDGRRRIVEATMDDVEASIW